MNPPSAAGQPTAAPNFPTIPGCRLIALAGQGGMGTVYRAEQASPRRIVAVKVLSLAAASPEKLAAFHREAETIARMEHPNILPVYGFGEAEGRPYLLLRYLAGGNLAMRIRTGPLPLADGVRWTRAMAGALGYAHAHGLVHRDVKPSNMLLDEAGNAYMADFGIAAAAEAAGGEAATGSAAYMSPEQASGQPADQRSDLYSLAVSLFEMLTGQPPYTAETPLGVIVRHINDPIPSARARNPAIPPAVDALIQRGMAKNPADRPQTAAEFVHLLDQASAGAAAAAPALAPEASPTLLERQPAAAPIGRTASRSVLWVAAGVSALCLLGALVLVAGGALGAFLAAPRASATPPVTMTPSDAPTAALSPAPPGQLLAVNFADGLGGFGLIPADSSGGVAYANGRLHFSVLESGVEWYSNSGRVMAQDVQLDLDLQQTAGPALSEFGGICRWKDKNNFTAFAISGGGQYKIWQRSNGINQRLIDWTDAPSLAGGGQAPHHLSLTCAGTQLSLAVDGIQLGQTTAPDAAPGDVALFAGLRGAGNLVVDFQSVQAVQP